MFQVIYRNIIRQLHTKLAAEALSSHVERTFSTVVLKIREDESETALIHAHCLRLIGSAAVDVNLTGTCVFCLLRRPIFTLDYRHQLCSYCVIASGAAYRNSMYLLPICPWCKNSNSQLFSLKPPTAGFRILDLGTGSDTAEMCAFLKELHRNSITTLPLQDYFNVVVYGGVSSLLLVISLFVEEWSLNDAVYHARRATKARVHGGSITFGPHLKWPLRDLEYANGTQVVRHQLHSAPDENSRGRSTIIRYNATVCGNESIDSMSNRILANFFYIELIDKPCLASRPEICLLNIRCRVEPGPTLFNILRKFRQSRVYFRGDEPNYYISHLLPPEALQCISSSEEFTRIIEVMVSWTASEISVKIEGADGQRYHISGSPYPLGQLIRDQGLDCLFGKPNHSSPCDSAAIQENKTTMLLRAGKLQKTLKSLDTVIRETLMK